MSRSKFAGLALALGVATGSLLPSAAPAVAQANGDAMMNPVIPEGDTGTCNNMSWNMWRQGGTIQGIVWYTGGSGIGSAVGTYQSDGHFTIKIQNVYGSGPVGSVTGMQNQDGSLDVEFVGPACKTGLMHIKSGMKTTQQ
jgi:hypothetical protein